MSIMLVDNSVDELSKFQNGHHYVYYNALLDLKQTRKYIDKVEFRPLKTNIVIELKKRSSYLNNLKKFKYLHFLYLDSIYICPISFFLLKLKKIEMIATLHWYPNNILKKILLFLTSKSIDLIVVHSEFIKVKLSEFGVNNVCVIDYPSFNFIDSKIEERKLKQIRFLCIGGTRIDKGLDILINSFKFIPNNIKTNIIFSVAGQELDIKYKEIENAARLYNINVELINRKLTFEEYWELIHKCDVLLLPYRKIFAGNSGPMTDVVYANKFILGPNEGNLGYIIKKNDLGMTFEQENSQDLANKIQDITKVDLNKNHKYKKKLTVDEFKNKYNLIYNKFKN